MLGPDDVLLFAVGNISDPEDATIRRLRLQTIPLAEVKTDPIAAARRGCAWARKFDRLLIHLDVDVLEYVDFPIAEKVRRDPGLTFAQLSTVLPPLLASENFRALTVAEVNPDHAADPRHAFTALNDLLSTALNSTTS